MLLHLLSEKYPQIKNHTYSNLEIKNISRSNQNLNANTIFVAIKGSSWDGHTAILEALNKSCPLVVCEKTSIQDDRILIVNNTRRFYADIASLYFNSPAKKLKTLAVTGTNGKTTTAYMVESLWTAAKQNIAVVGTVDQHYKDKVWPSSLTSPDAFDLQMRFNDFLQAGADSVVLEASSHAIDQDRLAAIDWDAAIYTNLSQDHLDYHHDMQSYFNAKAKLFTDYLVQSNKDKKLAIINTDCPWGKRLFALVSSDKKSYGKLGADLSFTVKKQNLEGIELSFNYEGKSRDLKGDFLGEHNAYNLSAALLSLLTLNISPLDGLDLVKASVSVPGRLERIVNDKGIHVFVDYAHTPDALDRVLQFLNQVRTPNQSKLYVIFGCGGDRDKTKRIPMAQAAEKHADYVVVTSDNPRRENAEKIIADIEQGFVNVSYKTISDRKQAISDTLQQARAGDIVLIAGKGHENYQEIDGERKFFSDQAVVKEFFA